jgi:hypothetical protein
MINQNITPTPRDRQEENLLAEIRDFIRLAILKGVELKDVRPLLIKLDNWEASK